MGPRFFSFWTGLPFEGVAEQGAVARDLHLHPLGQRVDDGGPHPVQAARGLIGLARELPPRMQRGEDDLQRRELREFRVRVHRDAAPIVAHGQPVAGLQRDLDEIGMAGHRFVHGVVDDLGGQVVQGVVVGAADIHAGAPPDGLQPLQHLDVLGGIVGARADLRRARLGTGATEEVVHAVFPYSGPT